MYVGYIYSILKNKGHEVVYSTNNNTKFENYDFIILVSSIVCFETEINILKNIKKKIIMLKYLLLVFCNKQKRKISIK